MGDAKDSIKFTPNEFVYGTLFGISSDSRSTLEPFIEIDRIYNYSNISHETIYCVKSMPKNIYILTNEYLHVIRKNDSH